VDVKCLTDIFDLGDPGLHQLNGTKAMRSLIGERITIEGSLIDKDGAITVEILEPDAPIYRHGALRQSQVLCEIQLRL
jgi:hypothetical protein